ncbi:MAG TPA: alpha/beta hydrolase [Vicinamibacterales bacterium]|nr:alpha/beta hydrolase [Vicinamibacterales bacterium]
MRRGLLLLALLSTSVLVAAQVPSPPPQIASALSRMDRHSATTVTFANGTRSIQDLEYWNPVGYRPLTLDVYLPPTSLRRPRAGFPLVIEIHGGGWMIGNKRANGPFVDWPTVLASLSAKGYVVAAVDYRLSSEGLFPLQAQDIKASIRWLRLNASKYGIDRRRVLTWGESAGAHLAALTTVSCGAGALEPREVKNIFGISSEVTSTRVSDCVQAGVTWFGVFNMASIQGQAREAHALSRDERDAPEWRLLGCFATQCRPAQLTAASPIAYVDAKDPPMMLIVGSDDTTVPMQQTIEMSDKLAAVGVKHELIVLPGVNHSFIGKTPEKTREANLAALAATFRFIDETIGQRSDVPAPAPAVKAPAATGGRP